MATPFACGAGGLHNAPSHQELVEDFARADHHHLPDALPGHRLAEERGGIGTVRVEDTSPTSMPLLPNVAAERQPTATLGCPRQP
eukprot:4591672-Lingulodinium_polyedra.AAC.1